MEQGHTDDGQPESHGCECEEANKRCNLLRGEIMRKRNLELALFYKDYKNQKQQTQKSSNTDRQ